MVKKAPHGAVLVVRCKDGTNRNDWTKLSSPLPTPPVQQDKHDSHQYHLCSWCNMQAHAALSSATASACPLRGRCNSRLRSCHTQTGATHSYAHYHMARNQQEWFDSLCVRRKQWCCDLMWQLYMWVWRLFLITQQPAGVTGSYAYRHVTNNTEKRFMYSPWT
jgi:hypothetical protein